jgi:hypothetical protein
MKPVKDLLYPVEQQMLSKVTNFLNGRIYDVTDSWFDHEAWTFIGIVRSLIDLDLHLESET